MDERPRINCFKPGICMDQNANPISECPNGRESTRYIDTTPLLPAESLCLTGLQAFRESRSKDHLVDNLASFCFDLDRAIAIPRIPSDDFKRDLFIQASALLYESQQNRDGESSSNLAATLQLNRFGVFMPAFRTRVQEVNLSHNLVKQTHAGLCSYIQRLDQSYMDTYRDTMPLKKQIISHKAECEVMALLTRLGKPDFFPYPSVAREEASHARKQHNHDFYTLENGHKHPVQVKTSSGGNGYKSVAIVKHYDILRALKRDPVTHNIQWNPSKTQDEFEWPNPYRYAQVLAGEVPSPLTELLIEELQQGPYLPRDKRNTLNLASQYVLSRLV